MSRYITGSIAIDIQVQPSPQVEPISDEWKRHIIEIFQLYNRVVRQVESLEINRRKPQQVNFPKELCESRRIANSPAHTQPEKVIARTVSQSPLHVQVQRQGVRYSPPDIMLRKGKSSVSFMQDIAKLAPAEIGKSSWQIDIYIYRNIVVVLDIGQPGIGIEFNDTIALLRPCRRDREH